MSGHCIPSVTIVVVTWNAADDIEECLDSMLEQTYSNYEILIVDSCSTDNTLEIVREKYPTAKIHASSFNLGYRRGNRLGMQLAEGDYVVVCNDDVRVDRHWLDTLVRAMEQDPSLGLATPLILNYYQPQEISAAGNNLHYTGISGHSQLRFKRADICSNEFSVATVSGCCFILSKEMIDLVGGFSKDFDVYEAEFHASTEDQDLSWRIRLHGYDVRCIPDSIVYHKHLPRPVPIGRFMAYEMGRHLMILRNYEFKTMLLVLPMVMFLETLSWIYVVLLGHHWIRAKAYLWKWMISNHGLLRKMRAEVQSTRTVSDSVILEYMSPTIEMAHATSFKLVALLADALFNGVSLIYYRFLRKVIH